MENSEFVEYTNEKSSIGTVVDAKLVQRNGDFKLLDARDIDWGGALDVTYSMDDDDAIFTTEDLIAFISNNASNCLNNKRSINLIKNTLNSLQAEKLQLLNRIQQIENSLSTSGFEPVPDWYDVTSTLQHEVYTNATECTNSTKPVKALKQLINSNTQLQITYYNNTESQIKIEASIDLRGNNSIDATVDYSDANENAIIVDANSSATITVSHQSVPTIVSVGGAIFDSIYEKA